MEQTTIEQRKVLSDKTYRLEEVTFAKTGLDGSRHSQTNEVYFRPDAVAVLLIDREKQEFILARQFRLPVFLNPHGNADANLLEACAGLMEEGETPEAAVVREVEEELGYRISAPLRVGAVYTSAGGLTEYLHLFLAEVDEQDHQDEGGGAEDENEDIELVRLPIEEARRQLLAGSIDDAKTMLLLQHYFLRT